VRPERAREAPGARHEQLVAVAVGVVAAATAWLRLDARTRGVVWAEDGRFLEDRLRSGPGGSLLEPFQGYLHVLPRAVVELAAVLPLRHYAVAVTGLSCLVVGAVAALVYVCSRDVLVSRAARCALALVTVLVPTAAVEALGNTANLHWFLLWLTPWVLLCRPRSTRQGWALGLVLLLVALSELQAVYFVPLLLLEPRDRRRWPMAAGLLVGLAAQVAVLLATGRSAGSADSGNPTVLDLVQGYGLHVFLQQWLPGRGGVGEVLVDHGWPLVVLASLPFLVAVGVLVGGGRDRDDRVVSAAVLVGAVVPFVAGLVLNFRDFLAFADLDLATLAVFAPLRYALVPSMFVLAAVVVVADRLARAPSRVRQGIAVTLLLALGVLGVVHAGPGPTNRSGFPGWASGVAVAVRECRAGAERVAVPQAPEGWEVDVDCARVLAGGPRR
jgi:hypothetical protein